MTSWALPQEGPPGPETTLLSAAARGETEQVRALLELGIDVDAGDERGVTPLMLAARGGYVETMQMLVEAGADLDRRPAGGVRWPPLMNALHRDQRHAALALLAWGADASAGDDTGYCALMMAAGAGDAHVVRELLARGADPTAKLFLGFTALDYAIGYGHADIARLLLEAAPALRQQANGARRTVTLLARLTGHDEILDLLA